MAYHLNFVEKCFVTGVIDNKLNVGFYYLASVSYLKMTLNDQNYIWYNFLFMSLAKVLVSVITSP